MDEASAPESTAADALSSCITAGIVPCRLRFPFGFLIFGINTAKWGHGHLSIHCSGKNTAKSLGRLHPDVLELLVKSLSCNVKTWFKILFALFVICQRRRSRTFANLNFIAVNKRIWLLGLCVWMAMFFSASARTTLNTDNPVGFFTTVADKMLRNTFSFGITNIPVYSNSVFIYTPSVQRLLQLSANIYDASTTNFYPTVFRPIFEHDNLGNVFIIGFTNLSSGSGLNTVSGAGDLQLAPPYDIDSILSFPANTPIADADGLVNVYGVPWIIGAKKGLPNFNEFSMQDVLMVFRKLQVTRPNTNSLPNATNQLYVFSVTNSLGAEFWNSYTNGYSNQVQVVVNDNLSMQIQLTNGLSLWSENYQLNSITNVITWPGNAFFLPLATNVTFLPNSAYLFVPPSFYYVGNNPNPTYQLTVPAFPPPPQMLLQVTNHLQVIMLDNNHVIDYVHFSGPGSSRNLNSEFQNTNTTIGSGGTAAYYTNLVWSTVSDNNGVPFGIETQIAISDGTIPLNTVFWKDPNAKIEIDGFRHFLNPAFASIYGSQVLYVTNLVVQVPYTPTAISYEYTTYQANDPLVHYLKSDLNYAGYDSDPNSGVQTGVHQAPANAANYSLLPDLGKVNARYQPWGKNPPTGETGVSLAIYDENPCNLAFKDPLVKSSDSWNFPTGISLPLTTLGQIHRGTPWQTVYLKALDILSELNPVNPILGSVGTNTWAIWTGNPNINDAALTAPISDRQLVGLLVPLMNTNDSDKLLSVNDPSLADWLNTLNGLVVLTNSATIILPTAGYPPEFESCIMTSNSPQALLVANAITQTRINQPSQSFQTLGDILRTYALTVNSPWLNTNSTGFFGNQIENGISDEAYEAIPAQLLPLLRPDSVGKMIQINGGWNIQFSGSDGFDYALQTSTDLISWNSVSTNCPVQGHFSVPISRAPTSQGWFYRSVLLP
jgi:hypothetical protein